MPYLHLTSCLYYFSLKPLITAIIVLKRVNKYVSQSAAKKLLSIG